MGDMAAVMSSNPPSAQPNLNPPITTTEQALAYKAELQKIDPNVEYLMTLYLSPDLTPDEVRKAKKAGIAGSCIPISYLCVFYTMLSYRRQIVSERRHHQFRWWNRILRGLLSGIRGYGTRRLGPQFAWGDPY